MQFRKSLALGMLMLLAITALWILGFSKPWTKVVHSSDISGTVRDRNGPIANAVIRYQAANWSVRTDARGRFRLPVSLGRQRVTAWKRGFYAEATRNRTPSERNRR